MQVASISSVLYPLAVLGCPVGMGAMMWTMMKRPKGGHLEEPRTYVRPAASVGLLREEHRLLGQEVERLEEQHEADARRHR